MKYDPHRHRVPSRPKVVAIFERSVQIARSAQEVLEFCLDGENFSKILPFRIEPSGDTDERVGRAGHVYPFNLRLGPASLRWEAYVSEQGPQAFTDVMLKGPMRWWSHTHRCEPTPEGCIYSDHVEYRTHFGLVADRTVIARAVARFFTYRQMRMKRLLEERP